MQCVGYMNNIKVIIVMERLMASFHFCCLPYEQQAIVEELIWCRKKNHFQAYNKIDFKVANESIQFNFIRFNIMLSYAVDKFIVSLVGHYNMTIKRVALEI